MHHVGVAGARVNVGARFPLAVHSSGRYLVDARGAPFFLNGDTPWSITVQLTRAQIDTYLANRQAKGFNTILFNAIEHQFSSQSPAYKNVAGDAPFSTMTGGGGSIFDSTKIEAYWKVVDYVVDSCLMRGMVCLINPIYWGFNGGSEGWWTEISAETNAALQNYGAWLAGRYTQPNILWSMGGDWGGGSLTDRQKQWNVVTGMRTVRTTDLITAHDARPSEAYTNWNSLTGFNLNNIYAATDASDTPTLAATAMGRSMPFFLIEAGYEGSASDYWKSPIQAVMSGACGHYFGHTEVWNFDYNATVGGPAGVLASYLDTTGATRMQYLGALMASVPWHKLQPKTDTSLVTTSLSTGATRICPMLSSDKDFAMIWVPNSASVTVSMAALSSKATLRTRWWDPTAGTYATAGAGSYANAGTQAFTASGDKVLVID